MTPYDDKDVHQVITAIDGSLEASHSSDYDKETYAEAAGAALPQATVSQITHVSSVLGVLVAGIALFSDGYNAQIIGYMGPFFAEL